MVLLLMKVIAIVGSKSSGKTSLIERIIPHLSKYGSVGAVKHIHAGLVEPKTDTKRIYDAGAVLSIGTAEGRTLVAAGEYRLTELLDELCSRGIDFALLEGFKSEAELPKIVLGDIKVDNALLRYESAPDANVEEITQLILSLDDYETLQSLIRRVKSHPGMADAGCVVTFTGIVRRDVKEKGSVMAIDVEKYDGGAESKIGEICDELKERGGIIEVLIHHRKGYTKVGDEIVYIVVAAAHRAEGFKALSDAIDMVKEFVPIWKKEITSEGAGEWVLGEHDPRRGGG